jgi:hypothetical protein
MALGFKGGEKARKKRGLRERHYKGNQNLIFCHKDLLLDQEFS